MNHLFNALYTAQGYTTLHWTSLQVAALDSSTEALVTYKASLANWLQGERPYQALDSPATTNPQCPFTTNIPTTTTTTTTTAIPSKGSVVNIPIFYIILISISLIMDK